MGQIHKHHHMIIFQISFFKRRLFLLSIFIAVFNATLSGQLIKLPLKQRPYHIGNYDRKLYRECVEKATRSCGIDTTEFKGWSLGLNLLSGWSLGQYRQVGNRGFGTGFNISYAYQPLKRVPLEIYADVNLLYSDNQNRKAVLPVFPIEGNSDPIDFPVQVNSKNELVVLDIGLRAWLPTRYWQPYAMAGIGLIGQSTLLRLYDDDKILWWGLSNKGLLLESRVAQNSGNSQFAALGVWWNAGYNVSLDLRFTYVHSPNFNYRSLKQTEAWNVNYTQTDSNGNPTELESSNDDLFTEGQPVSFNMLLISIGCNLLFDVKD